MGTGPVVTGSVSSGQVSVGESVEIQPAGATVRLREIQNHDQGVETISRGSRGAINLAGIHHDEIGRGQEAVCRGPFIALADRNDIFAFGEKCGSPCQGSATRSIPYRNG